VADKVDTYRPVRQNSHPHPNYHSPCTNWLSLWPSGELGGTAHTPRSRRSSSVTKQSCPHCVRISAYTNQSRVSHSVRMRENSA